MEDDFRAALLQYFDDLRECVTTESGDWTVKGFIDIYRRVYTISLDTKVLSKVLELLMFPVIVRFAQEQGYDLILTQAQNQYPDVTLVSHSTPGQRYALDIKTTYRTGPNRVSGMTLGTFGGYFRTRDRPISSTYAYNRYLRHYVLGVVYSRMPDIDERKVYDVTELADIPSVANDFTFFLQEKYRIASDGPGSGNTKNIGSTKYLDRLANGTGVFAELGVEVFDDYWMNYRTNTMAREQGFEKPPYTNLKSYAVYKRYGSRILGVPDEKIQSEAVEESTGTYDTDTFNEDASTE